MLDDFLLRSERETAVAAVAAAPPAAVSEAELQASGMSAQSRELQRSHRQWRGGRKGEKAVYHR